MAKASDIIKKATSYLGTKENPAGSNKVKFNTDYYGREVKGASYPWCCTFVWDIFRLANASELFLGGGKTAYDGLWKRKSIAHRNSRKSK